MIPLNRVKREKRLEKDYNPKDKPNAWRLLAFEKCNQSSYKKKNTTFKSCKEQDSLNFEIGKPIYTIIEKPDGSTELVRTINDKVEITVYVSPKKSSCSFCKKAGRDFNHSMREGDDPNGPIVCQFLKNMACSYCGEKGHTKRYCSQFKNEISKFEISSDGSLVEVNLSISKEGCNEEKKLEEQSGIKMNTSQYNEVLTERLRARTISSEYNSELNFELLPPGLLDEITVVNPTPKNKEKNITTLNKETKSIKNVCDYCKNKNMPKSVYQTHTMFNIVDGQMIVSCPLFYSEASNIKEECDEEKTECEDFTMENDKTNLSAIKHVHEDIDDDNSSISDLISVLSKLTEGTKVQKYNQCEVTTLDTSFEENTIDYGELTRPKYSPEPIRNTLRPRPIKSHMFNQFDVSGSFSSGLTDSLTGSISSSISSITKNSGDDFNISLSHSLDEGLNEGFNEGLGDGLEFEEINDMTPFPISHTVCHTPVNGFDGNSSFPMRTSQHIPSFLSGIPGVSGISTLGSNSFNSIDGFYRTETTTYFCPRSTPSPKMFPGFGHSPRNSPLPDPRYPFTL